ncbi:molybdate ABC transporter substrate-binding protein [Actinomadura rudentiformis]|uniref:Molybdate ABC transporter substrate-binding protein n=1 Tax=Actinomadura rudentiformis TaxID=359158 RepID=A0A6H9YR15_9ACTN|nr:molybdate ABC transporter substrate-binding protein [Actinomadura rudentiformis]KAB2342664.1 molybdate ABC transporter substrate-binding protein [Actinomadura rudentiformis]
MSKRSMSKCSMPMRVAVAAGLSLLAAGCGDTGEASGGKTLTVFAAASLTESFTSLGTTFEASHRGVKVRFNFGGSSGLAQQIGQGAPADVFASASPAPMKQVSDESRVFARNRLVIAVPKDDPGKVTKLADLAGPRLKIVVCAEQVPCGAAATKAFAAAGVRVKPASQEQDVRAVLTKVSLGEADAGLVYRTDAKAAAAKVRGIEFPESAKAINDYPIVALPKAPQSALAKEFVQLVLSAQGQAVLAQAGFEPASPG